MQHYILISIVLLGAVLAGCATQKTRYEQCSHYAFAECLAVTAQQCDEMFSKAHLECQQTLAANTMFDSMPDSMKEGYLNRCLVDSVVNQSGLDKDETKSCLRW